MQAFRATHFERGGTDCPRVLSGLVILVISQGKACDESAGADNFLQSLNPYLGRSAERFAAIGAGCATAYSTSRSRK
jgi:hypothetical protein